MGNRLPTRKLSAAVVLTTGVGDEKGEVTFRELSDETTEIHVHVWDVPEGKHGIHVHNYGDSRKGCESMGPHYNPTANYHGGFEDTHRHRRHVGDLGNITVGSNGKGKLKLLSKSIKVADVLGRGFVLHADPDDLGDGPFEDSKTTGHSGARIACGVIFRAEHPQA